LTVPNRPVAVEVAAHAKINLRLRILARETSGYHQLETLFHRIELADVVRVRRTSGSHALDITGDVDRDTLGPTEHNLAWRAAQSYFASSSMTGGFAIELEKRIQVGAGLGGGSADAGAVLRALDSMAERPLGEAGLMLLAAPLGSDVAFLASEHAYALAWGRGERMIALDPPPVRNVLLTLPGYGVNTADAYAWLAAARIEHPRAAGHQAFLIHPPQVARWESIARLAVNDFEPLVAARHPEIASVLQVQRASPAVELALLSGSGSAVFAILRGDSARDLSKSNYDAGMSSFMTRTLLRVEPPSPTE
jgi:4-diphosphocytidyl-2-C-methyl-D-erythritol kinase